MHQTLIPSQVKLFEPQGHINASNSFRFRDGLNAAIMSQQFTHILIDLSRVKLLDSSGLGVLVSAMTLAERLGQQLSLCSVPTSVQAILELTQLEQAFEVFPDRTVFDVAQQQTGKLVRFA